MFQSNVLPSIQLGRSPTVPGFPDRPWYNVFSSEMVRQMEAVKHFVKIHMVDSFVLVKMVSNSISMKNHALILTNVQQVTMIVTLMEHVPTMTVLTLANVKLDSPVMARAALLHLVTLDSFSMDKNVSILTSAPLD